MMPCTEKAKNGSARALDKKYKKNLSEPTGPNSIQFHRNVPHNALNQNCPNAPALMNKSATRAIDKIYLKTTPSEPLVQIQNNFTEMFLALPST